MGELAQATTRDYLLTKRNLDDNSIVIEIID